MLPPCFGNRIVATDFFRYAFFGPLSTGNTSFAYTKVREAKASR